MFLLNLYTPEKRLVQGKEIEEVFVPAERGELNILPGHAPLMTNLSTGVMRYRLKGETQLHSVALSWGYCQVSPEAVNILAETAETPQEIDMARVERRIQLSTEQLNSIEADAESVEKHLKKLMRAKVRKEVAEINSAQ